MHRSRVFILASALCAALAACGTKGPLYVPGIPVTAQWPYPTPKAQPVPAAPNPADVPATTEEKK